MRSVLILQEVKKKKNYITIFFYFYMSFIYFIKITIFHSLKKFVVMLKNVQSKSCGNLLHLTILYLRNGTVNNDTIGYYIFFSKP